MAYGTPRPPTPADVERRLRQESGFGCAKCGLPFLVYHHIIPYNEEQHFRPEDMVALCGRCHDIVAGYGRDRQYAIKANPFNKRNGIFRGAMDYDKRNLIFRVGGSDFLNTDALIRYKDTPLIAGRIEDGQTLLTLNLYDKFRNRLLSIIDNEIRFLTRSFWDFECKPKLIIARHAKGDIALRVDFRKEQSIIEGKMWAGNYPLRLGRDTLFLSGGSFIKGGLVAFSPTGIQIEDTSEQRIAKGKRPWRSIVSDYEP